MEMNPIRYPLIDLGEGFAASKSTIGFHESPGEMGRCNRLGIMGGVLGDSRRFYDRDGRVYKITKVTPEPEISGFQRFLAYLCYNPVQQFEVELELVGEADLDRMKERIRELLANDPGDLLYQWTDDREWQEGLDAAGSVPELFDFLTNRALVDHYDYEDEEDESDTGGA